MKWLKKYKSYIGSVIFFSFFLHITTPLVATMQDYIPLPTTKKIRSHKVQDLIIDDNLVACITAMVHEAAQADVYHQLPEPVQRCYTMLSQGNIGLPIDDVMQALPSILRYALEQIHDTTRAPRPDAPNNIDVPIVGPGGVCDLKPVLGLLKLIKNRIGCVDDEVCCNTILGILGNACEKFGPDSNISCKLLEICEQLTDLDEDLEECCNEILEDISDLGDQLDECCQGLTELIINEHVETRSIICEKIDTINMDVNEIIETLEECCTDIQEDIEDLGDQLDDVGDQLDECCENIRQDIFDTQTIICDKLENLTIDCEIDFDEIIPTLTIIKEKVCDLVDGQAYTRLIRQTDVPFVITQPGTYCLAEDLTCVDNTFVIRVENTSNVKIDLKNHSITASTSCIAIDAENVTELNIDPGLIQNGLCGISVRNGTGIRIESLTFMNNERDICLDTVVGGDIVHTRHFDPHREALSHTGCDQIIMTDVCAIRTGLIVPDDPLLLTVLNSTRITTMRSCFNGMPTQPVAHLDDVRDYTSQDSRYVGETVLEDVLGYQTTADRYEAATNSRALTACEISDLLGVGLVSLGSTSLKDAENVDIAGSRFAAEATPQAALDLLDVSGVCLGHSTVDGALHVVHGDGLDLIDVVARPEIEGDVAVLLDDVAAVVSTGNRFEGALEALGVDGYASDHDAYLAPGVGPCVPLRACNGTNFCIKNAGFATGQATNILMDFMDDVKILDMCGTATEIAITVTASNNIVIQRTIHREKGSLSIKLEDVTCPVITGNTLMGIETTNVTGEIIANNEGVDSQVAPKLIFEPTTIIEPGNYQLAANIDLTGVGGTAIIIAADCVTLDLNGHKIIGADNGISINSFKNIIIKNGIFKECINGLIFSIVDNCAITHCRFENNETQIQIASSKNLIIDQLLMLQGQRGIVMEGVDTGKITCCTLNGLGNDSLNLPVNSFENCRNLLLEHMEATNCTLVDASIFNFDGCNAITLKFCKANDNQGLGSTSNMAVYNFTNNTHSCVVINCEAHNNSAEAFDAYGFRFNNSTNITCQSCSSHNTTALDTFGAPNSHAYGFYATGSSNCALIECVAHNTKGGLSGNRGAGFNVENSSNCMLSKCQAYQSSGQEAATDGFGFRLQSCENCKITECMAAENTDSGYVVNNCTACCLVDSYAKDNGNEGILLTAPNVDCFVKNNTLLRNGVNALRHTGGTLQTDIFTNFAKGNGTQNYNVGADVIPTVTFVTSTAQFNKEPNPWENINAVQNP